MPVFDDRYIKAKIRTCNDKVYTNFCCLNVPEDDMSCETFTFISIEFLLVSENKYYLQVYLDNCAYKIIDKELADYIDDNFFEIDEYQILQIIYYKRIDISKGIGLT